MNKRRFSFNKQERIVSQKLIDELFSGSSSHSMAAFPIRVVFFVKERTPDEPAVQVLMSVPKKRFKHAVDRNRTKRQLREAYRHYRESLLPYIAANQQLALAFIWLSDKHFPSSSINIRMKSLLTRIAKKI